MSDEQVKPKKNVIIFGETGVGKSSVVNMLLGRDAAAVSDEAIGCTFDYEDYLCGDYVLYDTSGLSEGSKGAVDIGTSIKQLAKLIKSLSKDGVHLLVFVIEKGRIKKSMEDNYELFVNIICDKKVPVVLAITHCEQEKEMGKWWKDNWEYFVQDYQMEVKDCVSVCASEGDGLIEVLAELMKDRYGKSKARLWQCIEANALEGGWKMKTWLDWFTMVMAKCWNKIGKLFHWPRVSMWPAVKKALVKLGVSEEEATDLSNEFCEEVKAD